MDAFVSARIPTEIKLQGNQVLKEIGSTPTQLVNAAYKYVLENRALPTQKDTPVKRELSDEDLLDLAESIRATTFRVPESFWEGKTYKEIIAEGRAADYEALS